MRSSRRDVLTLVLAGGAGKRLYPLTRDRTKPAVPFCGKYRIIDFTLSNAFHSGARSVYVLIQYKSQSLIQHIQSAWSILSREMGHWIECVPPQQRITSTFYEGTADAVYQNMYLLEADRPRRVLLLSGDHVYRMDYTRLLAHHAACQADATLALLPVPVEEARHFGIVELDDSGRVKSFYEKPENPPEWPGHPGYVLANMGVYVFETEALIKNVVTDHRRDTAHDFGMSILPRMVNEYQVSGYRFMDRDTGEPEYWRDIGTLDAYVEAHRELLSSEPPNYLHYPDWPIRTAPHQGGPVRIDGAAEVSAALLSAGCQVEGTVRNSVLGPYVRVEAGAVVENCILHDSVTVERGARLRNVLIDKRVRVPGGFALGHEPRADAEQFMVTQNGTVVLPKGIVL